MTKRVPIISTIIVAAAVALMIWLGIWQLHRAKWKEGLIASYSKAQKLPPITWPTSELRDDQLPLFRYATGVCIKPLSSRAIGGENRASEPGYVFIVYCATAGGGPGMAVELGWSQNPNAKFTWVGGPVSGIIAPDRLSRMRLVAASSPAGLVPSRPPDISSISVITPAIHRGYAATWFGLAAIALIIYGLAIVRRRKVERATP